MDAATVQQKISALGVEIATLEAMLAPHRARIAALHAARRQQEAVCQAFHAAKSKGEAVSASQAEKVLEDLKSSSAQIAEAEALIHEDAEHEAALKRQKHAWERVMQHVEPHHMEHVRTAAGHTWDWPENQT